MGYASLKGSPKALTGADDIAPGAIELRHLSKELFAAIQKINLHAHTGSQSGKIKLRDLDGSWPSSGFLAYSTDGSKRYRVQVDNTGSFVITEVT